MFNVENIVFSLIKFPFNIFSYMKWSLNFKTFYKDFEIL